MIGLSAAEVSWAVKGTPIITGITAHFQSGRVTGLLGPNGSGKTTLLHVLAGLRRPTHGVVTIDGADVHAMRPRARSRQLAVVEQDASTGLDLRVREVVELGRLPHRSRWSGRLADPEGAEAVDGALRFAQVEHLAERRWAGLSGGERQRTHLARAVAQQPEVLLLDEPTNHLDLGHQLDFLAKVRGLGITTVAALHDLELAAAYCDDVVVLDAGRLVAAGPVREVLEPGLVARVYAVETDIADHPQRDRPHVRWNEPLEASAP